MDRDKAIQEPQAADDAIAVGEVMSTNGQGDGQPSDDSDWSPTNQAIRTVLSEARQQAASNPFANPILLAAAKMDDLQLSKSGNRTDFDRSLKELTVDAFRHRAERLRAYLGETDIDANTLRLRELIASLGHDKAGDKIPFEAFQANVERIYYGFVLTAHPTFSMTDELQSDLLALATERLPDGRKLTAKENERLAQRVAAAAHAPDDPMTLLREHEKAGLALSHLHKALQRLLIITADVAEENYPEKWHQLRPRLFSVASWVGYDLDGRSDIGWSTSFERRMASALTALTNYRDMIAAIRPAADGKPALAAMIDLIDTKLALAVRNFEDERQKFAAIRSGSELDQEAEIAALNRSMIRDLPERLNDGRKLLTLVEQAFSEARGTAAMKPLWVLAASIGMNGIAHARTHVRINAIQLHNAVRKTIEMDHSHDDPSHRLTYLDRIAKELASVQPQTIHMGSVAFERATAKRVFATIKLMQRFIDASEPIRFLIAECESSFTLLTALYYAKMFGVEDRVDISPLFENRVALEKGARMLEDALANPDYQAYLRKRGCLCLQTGFSDAGRFLGQTAASHLIEKIRLYLIELLQELDLTDIEVVIFDTHGESIGRGSHPGGFQDRLAYYGTAETKKRFAQAGVRLRQESSFQGGDGYIYFMNEAGALAVVTRVLEQCLASPVEQPDPFYEQRTYIDQFFAAVTQFNSEVIDDPCYATLLDTFGQNLSYKSGSRAVKRQFDGRGPMVGLKHPSQIRAIPHNSILQQLGILANTIGGLGRAVNRDPEAFQELYRESERFRRLMAMVEHAFKYTDLTVVGAYIDLFDPQFWLLRAETGDPDQIEEVMAVSYYMERIDIHGKLVRIMRHLKRDHMHLAVAFREHRRRTRNEGEEPIVIERQVRDTLHTLHSLRIAAIQALFRRAVHVPDFSDRHDTTHDDAIIHLMHLDVLPTIAALKQVFPLIDKRSADLDYGEPASYASSASQSYAEEHRLLFEPITEDYAFIRRIGAGLTHFIGSFG